MDAQPHTTSSATAIDPICKMRIDPATAEQFRSLTGRGVAGTIDGINDAPALAAAHVGIASAAMSFSSVSVIGNALRLRKQSL